MQEQKPISHIVAGLIIGAFMIVYSIALNFMGLMQQQALGWIGYGILIVGIIIFINLYGKSKNNYVGFGGLFGYGFKATAIIALLMAVFLIAFFMLFPEFKDKIMDAAREGMEKRESMTDDQIEQGLSMFEKNFLLFTVGGAVFMYVLLGCVASLIGAGITRKKPFNPLDQTSM